MDYTGSPPQTQRPQRPELGPYIASYPLEELRTEFQRKYPPDPFGEEMGASARVWKVFKDEATNYDKSLLIAWNKTLDILLIFAGLFSAVATAFVIESYKLLQPDYEEYIAKTLFIALSARNASDPSPNSVLHLADPADFAPLGSSRWLNGIWFTSLVLSLVVAFLCILLKQWLEEYSSRIAAPFPSLRQWARRRTFYFDGLTDWAVPVFIATLPLLLHAALFLFLVGLAILLQSLDVINAAWIITLTGCLFVFYAVSTLLPFVRPDCPSSTPVIRLLRPLLRVIGLRALLLLTSVVVSMQATDSGDDDGTPIRSIFWSYVRLAFRAAANVTRRIAALVASCVAFVTPTTMKTKMMETYWRLHHRFIVKVSIADPSLLGRDFSDREQEELEGRAVRWLVTCQSTPEVVVVGFQAIGALTPWSPAANAVRAVDGVEGLMRQSLTALYHGDKTLAAYASADLARSFRSAMCLFNHLDAARLMNAVSFGSFRRALACAPHYDVPLFRDITNADKEEDEISESRILARFEACSSNALRPDCRPHFLLSTAMQILYSRYTPLAIWLRMCHMLPLGVDIPIRDFVQMTKSLLRWLDRDDCALRSLHPRRDCSIQCSYELLSEIINSREFLALREQDARAGLDIILRYCKGRTGAVKELWVPVERSQFLAMLGSDIFMSHRMPYFPVSLQLLVMNLGDLAHCLQRSQGLPLWTPEWSCAIRNILLRAVAFQPHTQNAAEDVSFRLPYAITRMFNVEGPTQHIRMSAADSADSLPLDLLRGSPTSAWELLVSLPQMEGYEYFVDRLANLLAASLCAAARKGINVDTEFETFVTSSHLVQRLDAVRDKAELLPRTMKQFVTLVQHCIEIRSSCLEDILNRALGAHDAEYDGSLRRTIAYVREATTELGPCMRCPNSHRTFGQAFHRHLIFHGRSVERAHPSFAAVRAMWLGNQRMNNDYDRGAECI